MEQLAEKVRSIEQRKYEKERNKKIDKNRKEKVAYIKAYNGYDNFMNFQHIDFDNEENEIYLAELQVGPPYIYLMLKPKEKT